MESEIDVISKIAVDGKIDPTEFDVTISAFLTGLGAEKYVDVFRKKNIGQCTLLELSDEDLIKLGVSEPSIRQKITEEVKNLPIYEETSYLHHNNKNLGPIEIVEVLEETSQHLYRIYLSMLANTLALKKTKKVPDCLLLEDQHASDVALSTLTQMNSIFNAMDKTLHDKTKTFINSTNSNRNKKILVGAVGSAAIVVLAVLFVQSLKNIKQ